MQRIKYQLAHFKRLLPHLKQKQSQAKDTNYTMNILKTTNCIKKVEQVMRELELLQSLIKEEKNKIIYKLSRTPNVNAIQIKHIQQNINTILQQQATAAANDRSDFATGGEHYFDKIDNNGGIFYQKPNFQGFGIPLTFGMYDFPDVGGIGNNQLGSFKLPDNTTLKLYEHPNKKGPTIVYKGPARVGLLPSRWANRISGIELIPAPIAVDVECYSGMYFQGDQTLLKPGFYDYPDVGGVGNKQLASLRVPPQMSVTLYARPNKQGTKVTYVGPFVLQQMGPQWTNNVSGIEIALS